MTASRFRSVLSCLLVSLCSTSISAETAVYEPVANADEAVSRIEGLGGRVRYARAKSDALEDLEDETEAAPPEPPPEAEPDQEPVESEPVQAVEEPAPPPSDEEVEEEAPESEEDLEEEFHRAAPEDPFGAGIF